MQHFISMLPQYISVGQISSMSALVQIYNLVLCKQSIISWTSDDLVYQTFYVSFIGFNG